MMLFSVNGIVSHMDCYLTVKIALQAIIALMSVYRLAIILSNDESG